MSTINYDYQVKLVGILPEGFAFGKEPCRWDTTSMKGVRVPSEQVGSIGLLEREGSRNLEGTAIIEKISHLKPKPARQSQYSRDISRHEDESGNEDPTESNWVTESENSETDEESVDTSGGEITETDASLVESACSSFKSVTNNFRLTMLNDWNRGSLRMRWLKNNFDSKTDELPQIVCGRRFLSQFMTNKDRFYTIKAKKICFSSRGEAIHGRYHVIEISGGYSYYHLKEPYEEKTERREFFQPPAESSEGKSNAFYSAVLRRQGYGGVSSHKINILLDTTIDGVWTRRKDSQSYKCEDIAEIRHVEASTIYPPPWKGFLHQYKQCILAGHWAQSRLIGANKYLVNVYGDKNDSDMQTDKKLTEMWLYDVESMPPIIRQAARKEGFRAWNKKEMFATLYTSLQYIRNYMASPGIPEDEIIYFVHYEHESHLLPLSSDDMDDELACLREAKKTIIIKNISFDSPDLQKAEENAQNLVDSLMSQESGSERWPKPQLLMFPEQQMLHLKFKYLQHSTRFLRIAKKFIRTNTTPPLQALRISRKVTDRLQNLLNATAGYEDEGIVNAEGDHDNKGAGERSSNKQDGFYRHLGPITNFDSGEFIFTNISNAANDQNWRNVLTLPYAGK